MNATQVGTGDGRGSPEHHETGDESLPIGTLRDQEERLRELIRTYPVATALTALALGFALARWMRGR
jgi:hypothetical protein